MASADSEGTLNSTEPAILCSVLNVVIDHSMEDPTPMEPPEYQKQKEAGKASPIKVPVIRIFGPLVRDPGRGPLQSACLHVHGAFPYLLARPLVAGPDGSIRRASPAEGQVNWDDPLSVEQVVNSLAMILEDAIQSLDVERRQKQDRGAASTHEQPQLVVPVIRKVSVVQGRGFYTFCPGSVAPFLRVEYYDPKLRWKVKMMLERGLQVPLSYYPDPGQYDRSDEENDDVLRFNCYEAHIPYTMQFFKDFNLAGMSYVHVQQGKIRPSLRESCFAKYRAAPFEKSKDAPAVFLRSNTPPEYIWPVPDSSIQKVQSQQDGSDYFFDPAFPPPAKSTIADVEIDCTVHDLRNIDMVLKTLPSDLDERDKIQWRAVPSLQEIWRQERRRMAKLLTPEQDFLTPCPSAATAAVGTEGFPNQRKAPPPFTLNVKQGAERSGARLAVKGMKSLVKLTHGLDEDFERSLKQIVKRHLKAIEQTDQNLMHPQAPSPSFATPGAAWRKHGHVPKLTPNMDEAIRALDSLANTGTTTPKTPSLGDAVNALESLQGGSAVGDDSPATPRPMDIPQTFVGESVGESVDVEDTRAALFLTSSQQSQATAGLSYPSSQEIHQDSEPLTLMDPAVLSQRIDRGDTIFQDASAGRENMEDYIDADTLLPYETLDFGDDRCRVQFTVDTDPSATVRICGNLYLMCRRDGHNHQDESERARPGYYKTVTTGTFVDGIRDTSHAEYEDDEVDKEKFEEALSIMATQIPGTETGVDSPDHTAQDGYIRMQGLHNQERSQEKTMFSGMDTILRGGEPTRRTDPEDTGNSTDGSHQVDEGNTAIPSMGCKVLVRHAHASLPVSKIRPPETYPAYVTLTLQAPRRSALYPSANGRLHTTSSEIGGTPNWLTHASRYSSRRTSFLNLHLEENAYLQPVQPPPTRRRVQAWCRKRGFDAPSRETKRRKEVPDRSAARAPILEIDSSSRKTIAMLQGDSIDSSNRRKSNFSGQGVEEVLWQSSQPSQLSMSQQSQKSESESPKTNSQQPDSSSMSSGKIESSQCGVSGSITQTPDDALEGIGAQGGKIHVQGGGTLKAKTRSSPDTKSETIHNEANRDNTCTDFIPSPISFMSIEIHVQCRTGASRLDSKKISMAPDSSKDKIFAIVYVYGIDPGGGESLKVLERCCLFVRFHQEKMEKQVIAKAMESSMPRSNMGIRAPLQVECLDSEKRLLMRLSSLVTAKDPDMLLSWDTQSAGLGYIIERALVLGRDTHPPDQGPDVTSIDKPAIDMVRLLGRTPFDDSRGSFPGKSASNNTAELALVPPVGNSEERKWKGSGLGSEWDEAVGAGAAAASIVSIFGSNGLRADDLLTQPSKTSDVRSGGLFLLDGKSSPRKSNIRTIRTCLLSQQPFSTSGYHITMIYF